MCKQTIIAILLILCALCAYAEDSIKVSAADLQALIQRVERLEQQTAHPKNLGYTDAVSGASKQMPKDTLLKDTTKAEQAAPKKERRGQRQNSCRAPAEAGAQHSS